MSARRASPAPGPVLHACTIVLGGGVAGLRAAIAAAAGGPVLLLTKDQERSANTQFAQGGVAVALSDEDEVGLHLQDTLAAGAGLCDESAVRVLVGEGPRYISELIRWGARFDREGTRLHFTKEAAHSRRRILHAKGDATGREIMRALLAKARAVPQLRRISHTFALDLLVSGGAVRGVRFLHEGRVVQAWAHSVILCTGGIGRVFQESTNPSLATGDGIAMAWQVGAHVSDMEFVQFHPTALFLPGAPRFLISEAVRGEGGFLRNLHGDRFMARYHPACELAPRDVVSRSILAEMERTRSEHVVLDLTHLKPAFVRSRFPKIHRTCLQHGLDITARPIPVHPAAHYMMGGVYTDLLGRSTVPGLLAAGEAACTGVHGANRLASNSLLEGLVFGARAGEAARDLAGTDPMPAAEVGPLETPGGMSRPRVNALRRQVATVMWKYGGILRDGAGLDQLEIELAKREDRLLRELPLDRRAVETLNMVRVGKLVAAFAKHRQESRGAHFRHDFPSPDDRKGRVSWMRSRVDTRFRACPPREET